MKGDSEIQRQKKIDRIWLAANVFVMIFGSIFTAIILGNRCGFW